jgi:hypothetical protein
MGFFRRNYLCLDPRTLGLVRIAIALLLFADLCKRSLILQTFYINTGLIPNHRVLWQPVREWMFSPLLALSHGHEVRIAFGLIAAIYLCLLIGYRTRCMQLLAWLSLVSLEVRVDMLSNGADFVLSDLVLWTTFLPLGRRYSLDALLTSLRARSDQDLTELQASASCARDTTPVCSLAVLAATVQLSVIYLFNAVHKHGPTWRDGSAVYYMLRQERIVTTLGLWVREHVPFWCLQLLTYGTLVVELAIPLLLLSPWGKPWTRRAAILGVWGLHSGIALLANLGLFSAVMMTFSLLFITAQDWEALHARAVRAQQRVRLYIEESTGLYWQLARVLARLDGYGRIEIMPLTAAAEGKTWPTHGGYVVQSLDGKQTWLLEPALRRLLRALPVGSLLVLVAQLLRPLSAPALRWLARNRDRVSHSLGCSGARSAPSAQCTASPALENAATVASPLQRCLRHAVMMLREACVLMLMWVAISQVLIENPAIPRAARLPQPRFIHALVDYTRLNQGWSMFAPDAPTADMWIVVDAETVDGRHVDPYNTLASRLADPSLRTLPVRLGQSAAFCDYTVRIPDEGALHDPLRDWILRFPLRTKREQDRIVRFSAYVVEQRSPAPGEAAPHDVRSHVFLRY